MYAVAVAVAAAAAAAAAAVIIVIVLLLGRFVALCGCVCFIRAGMVCTYRSLRPIDID